MEQKGKSRLHEVLVDRIGTRGKITFAEFMAACLYEPGLGYYTSPGRKVGAEGDFYTSSNVHAVFGRLISRELCRMWENLGEPSGFSVVEVGAGGGRLARDILDAIRELNPRCYDALTYRLIEKEPSLRSAQQEILAAHPDKPAWSTPEELSAGSLRITGCILSNELIDSFPTHVVEMTRAGLQEVYVTAVNGDLMEIADAPSTPEIEQYLQEDGVVLHEGQRAEVNLAALRWIEAAAAALERGFVLTIDYGYLADELYAPARKNGTLLCYYRHTTEEDPYARLGEQDITTHVDFTALSRGGERAGLRTVWYGEQYRFLMGAGMMEEIMALEERAGSEEERLKNRLALKKLILPDGGMGDTFKVLVQAKGVAEPRLLCMRDWGSGF
ncbi:SAM-dependent methyltransferase, MidA family [Geobacter sp. DSM 9736]|nr:SAM-dependent methyltransferase, MidA family [Geobacter sp. DSM 9736]